MIESNDLTIGWISRLPQMDYVWNSGDPSVHGWPSMDEEVIWRAYVKNWSDSSKRDIGYRWLLDGVTVDSGSIDVETRAVTHIDYSWHWTFDRQQLTFWINDENEDQNRLSIYTDAISFLLLGFFAA